MFANSIGIPESYTSFLAPNMNPYSYDYSFYKLAILLDKRELVFCPFLEAHDFLPGEELFDQTVSFISH